MNRQLVYKILWSTIEEFVGLWEILWEVNTILHKDVSKNKELAKKIVFYFLETELIKLYYDTWGNDELREIDNQEAMEIIKGEKFWLPPEINDVCVKAGSTEKGEKYYNEELMEDIGLP